MPEYLAKKNQDGSYSVSIPAGELAQYAFVDYYDDKTGTGLPTARDPYPHACSGHRKVCEAVCSSEDPPRLFEMTANARTKALSFEPLDDEERLGFLKVRAKLDSTWLSMIDGGTRLLGIRNALNEGSIDKSVAFDVRIFKNLSLAEEVAMFLLINDKQKKVRTDLSLRVVQRLLDENVIGAADKKILESVVPDTDVWKYEASRVAAELNEGEDSPWKGLIKMPGDRGSKPIKLQAMFSSLKHLLTDEIRADLDQRETRGELRTRQGQADRTEYTVQVLKNFWNAVAEVCPEAHDEPITNVLWGSIGASACHIALAKVALTILVNEERPDLTKDRMVSMIHESNVAEYAFWFSKSGKNKREKYPGEKGEATRMTGGANYVRLAKILEQQWRSALHDAKKTAAAVA